MAGVDARNRCDRCGAQAYYMTGHDHGVLHWCAHHYRLHRTVLEPSLLVDNSAYLNVADNG